MSCDSPDLGGGARADFEVFSVRQEDRDADNYPVWNQVGDCFYATEALAAAVADAHNAEVEAAQRAAHNRAHQAWQRAMVEHIALVEAGHRRGDEPGPHFTEPTLRLALPYSVDAHDVVAGG